MIEFDLSIEINARRQRVWDEVSDLVHQPEWMDDAKKIRFVGSKTQGTGTSFKCDAKVWVFNTTDKLTVSQWIEGHTLTVNHEGAFKGVGKFTLNTIEEQCVLNWHESLTFPWYSGGALGEQVAKALLSRIWNDDLKSLKDKCEYERDIYPFVFFESIGQKVTTTKKGDVWTVKIGGQAEYAVGGSPFAARAAALARWKTEQV